MKEQRKAKRIAMSEAERDDFLSSERMCRVGTVDSVGTPHVSPLWFVWDGAALWLNSVVKSQRSTNLTRNRQISIVVDTGYEFSQLRGVEVIGSADVVGELPRSAAPNDEVTKAERLFGEKYLNGSFYADGRHAWVRIVPDKIVS